MNFRYKLNPKRQTVLQPAENHLPKITRKPSTNRSGFPPRLALSNNSFLFARLKETPTFHMLKSQKQQSDFQQSPRKKQLPEGFRTIDVLRLCNTEHLDNEIRMEKTSNVRGSIPQKFSDERLKTTEENALSDGRAKGLRGWPTKKGNRKPRSQNSIIYKRFFKRPNLNEIVDLSDLVRKKILLDQNSIHSKFSKRNYFIPRKFD